MWRNLDGDYEDSKGFCNSASIERVKELDTVLTLARISHNFRSEEPQGCVMTRRAKVWARKRTCSTLSTQTECNAVNARHCGSAVESL